MDGLGRAVIPLSYGNQRRTLGKFVSSIFSKCDLHKHNNSIHGYNLYIAQWWRCEQVVSHAVISNKTCIFKELGSRRKHVILLNFLVIWYADFGLDKTHWNN